LRGSCGVMRLTTRLEFSSVEGLELNNAGVVIGEPRLHRVG
jgi:hypothetical protein